MVGFGARKVVVVIAIRHANGAILVRAAGIGRVRRQGGESVEIVTEVDELDADGREKRQRRLARRLAERDCRAGRLQPRDFRRVIHLDGGDNAVRRAA